MKIAFTEFGISKFAEFFPSLGSAEGVWPWNPDRLDNWAAEFDRNENERHSARYILQLWNPATAWACGTFDASEATKAWDTAHKEAYLTVASKTSIQLNHLI